METQHVGVMISSGTAPVAAQMERPPMAAPNMTERRTTGWGLLGRALFEFHRCKELWDTTDHRVQPGYREGRGLFIPSSRDFIESRKHVEHSTTPGQELWEEDVLFWLHDENGLNSRGRTGGPIPNILRRVLDDTWKEACPSSRKPYEMAAQDSNTHRYTL
jgi:hypothetical protein